MNMNKPTTLTWRILRYGVAGVFATGVYFGVVLACVEIALLAPVPATVVATLVVMLTSYVVNRVFVFDTDRSHASSFIRFAVASILNTGLNAGLMYLIVAIFKWPYIAGTLLTTVIVPPINFVVNYLWAFRPATRIGDKPLP